MHKRQLCRLISKECLKGACKDCSLCDKTREACKPTPRKPRAPRNPKTEDIESVLMNEKSPGISFIQASMKEEQLNPTSKERNLVRDYVENVFKKVDIKFKNCEDLEEYKKVLR
jgi:hypothetical protein